MTDVPLAAPALRLPLLNRERSILEFNRRVLETSDADCRFRLVVASADAATGAVPRPLDECVDRAVWQRAVEGGRVSLRLVGGALGADLVGVESAP